MSVCVFLFCAVDSRACLCGESLGMPLVGCNSGGLSLYIEKVVDDMRWAWLDGLLRDFPFRRYGLAITPLVLTDQSTVHDNYLVQLPNNLTCLYLLKDV